MRSFGLNLTVEKKEKIRESNISSAFLKGSTKEHLHTALICMICPPCLPEKYTLSSAAHGKTGSREETCMTMFSCLQRARLSIWSICVHVSFSPTASHPTLPVLSPRSNGCCACGLTLLIFHRPGRISNHSFATGRVSIYGVQIFSSNSRRT